MTKKLSLYLLVIISFFSCWLLWHYVLSVGWETPGNPNNPDQFATNLEVLALDDNGKPEYYFSSPQLVHYVTNDRTVFQKPVIKMFEADSPPWILHADQGESLWGYNQVNLSGNVKVTQAKGPQNVATLITTTKATVYPKQRIATTDQYVSAIQPTGAVHSVGMKLNLNKKTLDLLSRVQGVYVPAKQ